MNSVLLRLSQNDFSFSQLQSEPTPHFQHRTYTYHGVENFSLHLQEAISKDPFWTSEQDNELREVLCDTPIVVMPLSLFHESDCYPVYNYTRTMMAPHKVFYDILPTYDAVALFAVPIVSCQAIQECFGEVRFTSKYVSMVDYFSTKGITHIPHLRLFVVLADESMDVMLADDQQLFLINTYEVHGTNDVAYYLFNILDKTTSSTERDEIYIAGPSLQRDKVVKALSQFSSRVYPFYPHAAFNRHIVSMQEELPLDLITYYCHQK